MLVLLEQIIEKSLRNLHHAIYLSRQIFAVSALNKLLHIPDFFVFVFSLRSPIDNFLSHFHS